MIGRAVRHVYFVEAVLLALLCLAVIAGSLMGFVPGSLDRLSTPVTIAAYVVLFLLIYRLSYKRL